MLSAVNEDRLYVATDAGGVEHEPTGAVAWAVPENGTPRETRAEILVLRRPVALLDALDEVIWLAEPGASDAGAAGAGGASTAEVRAGVARLVARCPWDGIAAAGFALDCAEHVLGDAGSVTLPGGHDLAGVIAEARRAIGDPGGSEHPHLGFLARRSALRRLQRVRRQLADLEADIVLDDEQRNVDVVDDPDFEIISPLAESVLAAVEALREQVWPRPVNSIGERREEHEENRAEEARAGDMAEIPQVFETPFGAGETGPHLLQYQPPWTSAMEAARHARQAALDAAGPGAEDAERAWQAARLEEWLSSPA
jgi:hypothetical protein